MRRYLAALIDGGGNITPELHAAQRLVARGHHVTVLADDSVAADVAATGAKCRRWAHAPNRRDRRPENDPARDWECNYPWQLVERLVTRVFVGPAAAYTQDVTDAIRETDPDLVICSMFCLGGMIAAEASARSFDVLFANIYPLPLKGMPPFGVGLRPARGFADRLRDTALNAATERLWDWHGLAPLNQLRAQHGLASLPHFFDQVRQARRHLVLTSQAFDFPAALPPGVRYVGPILDDPVWADNTPWTPPAGAGPLVLVAMSSTFQDQVGCLQRVIDALGRLPVRGLVTTGPAIHSAALSSPPNVTVVASAPHHKVLQQAALVVTHGGHGTVVKALAAGVPLVVLPHGRDQADNAIRITERGAGRTLPRSSSPSAIAGAVEAVLGEQSYRSAAARLGTALRRDADSSLLIEELESAPERSQARGDETSDVETR
jgi:MGT family glycosyltransferase